MKAKALSSLGTKLYTPCKNLIQSFKLKLKLKKPISIRSLLRPHSHNHKLKSSSSRRFHKKTRFSSLFFGLCPFKQQSLAEEEMDHLTEFCSVSEAALDGILFPSPLTPGFVKIGESSKGEECVESSQDEACRSFEKYLVEMIVEEGKVTDLKDVEELLCCWKNLKSPVFVDLVSRFYGELCKDLFSPEDDENDENNVVNNPM